MNRKIALLPVDGRPVTRELPKQIASIGNWEVLIPHKDLLGFLKEPGDMAALEKWMWKVAPEVDGFVLSIDMLGYGGLVPSRVCLDGKETIIQRIGILRALKEKYPDKALMAFSSTMRISNNYVNEEEKEYWCDYGVELWEYSYHFHRFEKTGHDDSNLRVRDLQNKIPSDILEDYLSTRLKNYQVNESLLEMVEDKTIDVLVFPQDDTSEYGLNIGEQEELSDKVAHRELFQNVFIYPGADEVANTLVAKMIYQLEQVDFPTFYPVYSGETGALSTAMYEDRPICESVKGQIHAFGGYTVDQAGEADIVFAVNVPGKRQGDLALQKFLGEVDTPHRNIGEWIKRIAHYLRQDKLVAVADTAYANGVDPRMLPRLLGEIEVSQLAGFGGWNTAGNTLGTVVAQAAMVHLQKKKPSLPQEEVKARILEEMTLRLLDEYVYQSIVRQQVRAGTDESAVSHEELLNRVKELFLKESVTFLTKYGLDFPLKEIYLPWKRTFEIGLGRRDES
ncbi:DUF4127 family protein [Rossellomorea yichunensis]|jgi:Protein of unknown function (DUF4127)|uniref:DUF4127 family protein n=1 Tax=Rossellomorea yichunensis TaxID=3077331 RepID=UPI0028DE2AA8|nr:DUF4127 family protein [Rossellomorea sp. YC4-1]MDT9026918.1 DUF4127 family protein [Rossellomorea sp. YC4-1]